MEQQQRLAKSLSPKQKGSHNRRDAAAKLGRHHYDVANVRRYFLHQVSGGPPSMQAGPPTPADGTALTSTPLVPVKPARLTREPTFTPHPRPEPTTPEKGGAEHSTRLFDTL